MLMKNLVKKAGFLVGDRNIRQKKQRHWNYLY